MQLPTHEQMQQSPKGNPLRNFRLPNFDYNNKELLNNAKKRFIELISEQFLEANKPFIMTDELRPKIAFCFNWVIGLGIDWKENKGLQLFGDVGTGKSCILKAVVALINELYWKSSVNAKYVTSTKIASLYRSNDPEATIQINRLITCRLLFIDDLGKEDKQVFNSTPVAEIIMERYDKRKFVSFTTNFNQAKLIAHYNESIEDKLSHGTYLVSFTGQSQRQ